MVAQVVEVALLAAVQVPVGGVGPRVERRQQAEIDVDAHDQHAAIHPDAAEVRAGMIRRADPAPRLRDDAGAIDGVERHGEVSQMVGIVPFSRREKG